MKTTSLFVQWNNSLLVRFAKRFLRTQTHHRLHGIGFHTIPQRSDNFLTTNTMSNLVRAVNGLNHMVWFGLSGGLKAEPVRDSWFASQTKQDLQTRPHKPPV